MLRAIKTPPKITPVLRSGSPLFYSNQAAKLSGEESEQVISKIPFSFNTLPLYETMAQEFATNPETA